jgi:hypothetical protein
MVASAMAPAESAMIAATSRTRFRPAVNAVLATDSAAGLAEGGPWDIDTAVAVGLSNPAGPDADLE